MFVCYSHPKATIAKYADNADLFNRKPEPGMIFRAMLAERVTVKDTLMVGDRPEDEQAARNAGVDFMSADEFFSTKG